MKLDRVLGRPPRPGEITRLPGTGNRGGSAYSYTVIIESIDPVTGETRTNTMVIVSGGIEEGDVIRARAIELAQRGEWTSRQGTDPTELGSVTVVSATIASVYRGTPDVGRDS